MTDDARTIAAESRIQIRPVGWFRASTACLTGPASLDLLGDPSRPATVTNCYRVHREAAANWEVVEATDAQLAQLRAAGYDALADARDDRPVCEWTGFPKDSCPGRDCCPTEA